MNNTLRQENDSSTNLKHMMLYIFFGSLIGIIGVSILITVETNSPAALLYIIIAYPFAIILGFTPAYLTATILDIDAFKHHQKIYAFLIGSGVSLIYFYPIRGISEYLLELPLVGGLSAFLSRCVIEYNNSKKHY